MLYNIVYRSVFKKENVMEKKVIKKRSDFRFEREAKALQKNLIKRKKQQEEFKKLKETQNAQKEQEHGQD